jgi:hypothetical protein
MNSERTEKCFESAGLVTGLTQPPEMSKRSDLMRISAQSGNALSIGLDDGGARGGI